MGQGPRHDLLVAASVDVADHLVARGQRHLGGPQLVQGKAWPRKTFQIRKKKNIILSK